MNDSDIECDMSNEEIAKYMDWLKNISAIEFNN